MFPQQPVLRNSRIFSWKMHCQFCSAMAAMAINVITGYFYGIIHIYIYIYISQISIDRWYKPFPNGGLLLFLPTLMTIPVVPSFLDATGVRDGSWSPSTLGDHSPSMCCLGLLWCNIPIVRYLLPTVRYLWLIMMLDTYVVYSWWKWWLKWSNQHQTLISQDILTPDATDITGMAVD